MSTATAHVTIACESWPALLPELQGLWTAHHAEIAQDQDGRMPLDVDVERYGLLAATDILHLMALRVDGQLVGYWAGFIMPHLHYQSTRVCLTDVYYIVPTHRNAGLGRQFFQAIEAYLRTCGVQKAFVQSKVYADHSKLFESLGWTLTEYVHTKWLGA